MHASSPTTTTTAAAPSVGPVVRVLGSRPVADLATVVTRRRLRVLAYHGVHDASAFAAQLDLLSDRWTTTSGKEIADHREHGRPVPPNSVWITFDDGDTSVVRTALPLLSARGMKATAFLCGAWVGSDDVPWWHVAEAAVRHGVIEPAELGTVDRVGVLRAMKRLRDDERRSLVRSLSNRLEQRGQRTTAEQWSERDVTAWLDGGMEIGNHSWDHPCLDRCSPEVQIHQVRRAHERLSALAGAPVDTFAWPNGDPSGAALVELKRLRYRVVLPAEHRVCRQHPDLMALSRLRIDADAPLVRFRSILSGGHSGVFQLQRRIGRRGATDAVT